MIAQYVTNTFLAVPQYPMVSTDEALCSLISLHANHQVNYRAASANCSSLNFLCVGGLKSSTSPSSQIQV